MRLSYKQQLILVGFLIVALAALVTALLIVPRLAEIGALKERTGEVEAQISQAEALVAQRQTIKARSAVTEAERMRLANEIPESPELPALIMELQDTVNMAGLEFTSLTPSQPIPVEAGYSEISISVEVMGKWADTVDLLQRLPRLTRQLRIVSFDTVRSVPADPEEEAEAVSEENLVQTTIVLRAYTMPSEIVPPAPPAESDVEGQQ